MKLRTIIPFVFTMLIMGCASISGYDFEPDSLADAEGLMSYHVDEFEGDAWLKTEPVVNLEHPSAIYHLRAHYTNHGKMNFLQVYVNLRVSDWYFLEGVAMKGESATLTKIDREVVSGGYVHEDVAVNISIDTLNRMSQRDTKIKLKGKRGDYVFSVNKHISKAMLDSIESKSIAE